MADYASDEEQIEALKRWWRDNGRSIIVGIVIGVAAVGGWQGWQWYTETRLEEAAGVYRQIAGQGPDGDGEAIFEAARTLRADYAGTTYATLGALAAARTGVEAGDLASAAEWLEWARDNAPEPGLAQIARLRLARVLGEAGEIDRALDLVRADAAPGWAALRLEIEGDLLSARGDHGGAAEAYERALEAEGEPSQRSLLELKANRARARQHASPESATES